MKLALIFVVAILVVTTHQYFDYEPMQMTWLPNQLLLNSQRNRPRDLVWWLPKHILSRYQQQQNHYDDIPYDPIQNFRPDVIYSQDDEELLNEEMSGPYEDEGNQQVFVDAQSRSRDSLPDIAESRIVLGSGSSSNKYFFQPFIKTATFTLTSTVSLSRVISCIVTGDFANVAAQAKPCRRRRFDVESMEISDEQFPIAPSEPIKNEVTDAVPHSIESMREGRQWNHQSPIVMSRENNKEERFVFNHYVSSTTSISYTFESTTVTKTVDVAINVGLNCVPTGYVVCT